MFIRKGEVRRAYSGFLGRLTVGLAHEGEEGGSMKEGLELV